MIRRLKFLIQPLLIKDTPMDYYYRGVIYRKLNNDTQAKKELEKAISKDKKLPEPRLELADLLLQLTQRKQWRSAMRL